MALAVERARLLFLTPVVPDQRGNGLAMRTGHLLDAYCRRFDVDVAIVPLAAPASEVTPFVMSRACRAAIFPAGTAGTHYALIAALKDPSERLTQFRRYGGPSIAARLTPDVRSAVAAWTGGETYSVVHVSRLYLAELAAPWLRARETTHLILDCDEDDAAVYRGLSRLEAWRGRPAKAQWLAAEADAFERLALRWLRRFDLVLAASEREAKGLRLPPGRALALPNVVPAGSLRRRPRPSRTRPKQLIFVGTMAYAPNADAVLWFVSRVWPRLRAQLSVPVRLLIVGQGPPPEIARLSRRAGILVTGRVGDLTPYYEQADLCIVPLRAGGGSRIKLLEAVAYGVPIVSSRLGAEGTALRPGRDILVADDATEFARCCLALLSDAERARRLVQRARRTVRRHHAPEPWADRLERAVAALGDRDHPAR